MMFTSYRLSFADGFSLQIRADNEAARPVVETLAQAMALESGYGDYSILVSAGRKEAGAAVTDQQTICRVAAPGNDDERISAAVQVSLAIAQVVQMRGGILVHGALADYLSQGVILAAPGGTGKTTASSRLPSPWRSLSDDAVLIMRNARGRYCVHPWPTWSRFYTNGPGGVWNTSEQVSLSALFFLFQSNEDCLKRLHYSQGAAMLIESVEQANRLFDRCLSPEEARENHRCQFNNLCSVLESIPAYRLNLTLTGSFWTLIEESLKEKFNVPGSKSSVKAKEETGDAGVVFSGNSMHPTLREPDYLEVVPYGTAKPRRGDVICFQSPGKAIMVVHRVMKVKPAGVITRGDNNPADDPGLLPFPEIKGRVSKTQGRKKRRRVQGGVRGMIDYYYARAYRKTRILAGAIYRIFLPAQFFNGRLHWLAPKNMRFQIVFFGKQPQGQLKILLEEKPVGYYRGSWHIAYPWRLWVNPEQIRRAAQAYENARRQWAASFRQARSEIEQP